MKKYEYRFVRTKARLGLDYDKKVSEAETQWNELGREGWRFCTWVDGAAVFVRETGGSLPGGEREEEGEWSFGSGRFGWRQMWKKPAEAFVNCIMPSGLVYCGEFHHRGEETQA